jgi:D-glycero-alpha-D-manno-heptose 1-phosphate guanylyltransferase
MCKTAENLSDATAVILVGGLGTRLRSAVADRPKVLAEVNQKPFLTYLLDQVATAGITRIVLCTGYRGDQVRAVLGDTYAGRQLLYSQEPTPLGTAGALRHALARIQSRYVLVMNGDSIAKADFVAFWAWHLERNAGASLLLAEVDDVSRYGQVLVDAVGAIQSFREKNEGGPGWINAGVYLIARSWIEAMPAHVPLSIERDIFPSWIGRAFYGYRSFVRFLDIGTPDTYGMAPGFLACD